jgi:hypothetical protein
MAATVGGKELKSIIRFVVAQWCEFVELSGTLFLSRFQIKQQKLTWMSPNMANGGKRSRKNTSGLRNEDFDLLQSKMRKAASS